jgi:hypothetical protein
VNDADRDVMLARIDERVSAIKDRLEVGDKRLDNHTGRLSALEKWRSALAGGLTLLGALIGWKLL